MYIKFSGLAVPGTAGIIISISFFSGVILFTLGVTGIFIARIFEEVRGRKSYIIKEIVKYNGKLIFDKSYPDCVMRKFLDSSKIT